MNYEIEIPFEGEFSNAADVILNTLLPLGFQIINKDKDSIEMEGTRCITGKNQTALAAITWIHLQKETDTLILKVDFGRFKKVFKLLVISSIVTDIVILPLILTVMLKGDIPIQAIIILAAILLSGLVIGLPMIYILFKNNATKAVDTIANNIAASDNYE